MSQRKKPSLPLMKIQGPGMLKYDLSEIPPKLRKKSNIDAATKSHKRRKLTDSSVLEADNPVMENPAETEESHAHVASSPSSLTYSIPIADDLKLYTLGITDCGYFCPCDANQTLFAIADYDKSSKQILKHKIQTVRRKAVNFLKNSVLKWIYCCSCNLVFAEYIDSLAVNLHSSCDEFQEMNCIHTEVVKQLTGSDVIKHLPDINQMVCQRILAEKSTKQ